MWKNSTKNTAENNFDCKRVGAYVPPFFSQYGKNNCPIAKERDKDKVKRLRPTGLCPIHPASVRRLTRYKRWAKGESQVRVGLIHESTATRNGNKQW